MENCEIKEKLLQVSESEVIQAVLKVQVLGCQLCNPMREDVSFKKDKILVGLKCTECSEKKEKKKKKKITKNTS